MDKMDRDFEHDEAAYTGKLRKQEGDGGWTFMAFKENLPFGPTLQDIEAPSADEAMDHGIKSFVSIMGDQKA